MQKKYDIAVIGGGINGVGIARDAVGRGLKTVLFERDDLASGTSSASTKLIHGGLRYLEHYDFALVRKALAEREVMLAIAPHLVSQLHFVLPHVSSMRPLWMVRLGLFLYDHIGGRKRLPESRALALSGDVAGSALQDKYKNGFEYADCRGDDARLVVANAVDAKSLGADIYVRTQVQGLRQNGGLWHIEARNENGQSLTVTARAVVNATGPWADRFVEDNIGKASPRQLRLIKGSHIIVPRLYAHDRAYLFQNDDERIVFAIPYEEDFTLIGTTDVDYAGDPAEVVISEPEISYLCDAVNQYFKTPVKPEDVVWSYAGVRPLIDESNAPAASASRGYELVLEAPENAAPLLHVFGGKLTTYRLLAEEVMAKLGEFFPSMGGAWTGSAPLPGGGFASEEFDRLVQDLSARYDFLAPRDHRRLARAYGLDAFAMLGKAKSVSDLGHGFGHGLYERELRWMMEREWARMSDDVLWRRSKLGLRFDEAQRKELSRWLETQA
jgi:glycerol-3-phosphate dehydrogenase